MKILGVHNYYGSEAPSGENIAYDSEIDLLRRRGHEVLGYTTSSDPLRQRPVSGSVIGAISCSWNPLAAAHLRRVLLKERPDVMHVHNVFPRLAPGIVAAAAGTGTATVMTLHNYRVACVAGTATLRRESCRLCMDAVSVRPAIRNRCYRNSILATIPVAAMIAIHRRLGTLANNVDAFIALTEFQRDLLSSSGRLPLERMHVRPNFMPGRPVPLSWNSRKDYVVFVGRLSAEKGVSVLLEAWSSWGEQAPRLVIVGDGEESAELKRFARDHIRPGKVEFHGQRPPGVTLNILRHARLLVLPSMCFEGFPLVVREAFAFGVPVVASRIGGLPQIVADSGAGQVFSLGREDALMEVLAHLWADDQALQRMSKAAVNAYRASYSEDAAYARVMSIYEAAIARRAAAVGVPA